MDFSIPKNIVLPPADGQLDESWYAPLSAVARAIDGVQRYRHFDLADFMIMNKVIRRPRADLVLYKHYWTRRYLNLDQAGHAYKYVPVRGRDGHWSHGRYVPHRDLRRALDHLGLWELPWMKPSLEADRHGLSVEDRWAVHPEELRGRTEEEAAAAWLAETRRWQLLDDPWVLENESLGFGTGV